MLYFISWILSRSTSLYCYKKKVMSTTKQHRINNPRIDIITKKSKTFKSFLYSIPNIIIV